MKGELAKWQLKALLDYIDARIEEKLVEYDRRDSLTESIRANEFREELFNAFGYSEN